MHTRIQHPGIIFPDEIWKHENGRVPQNKSEAIKKFRASREAIVLTEWGYTTNQAAKKMGISPSGARQYMYRHHIPNRTGTTKKHTLTLYWKKSSVAWLAQSREKEIDRIPEDHTTVKQLSKILGVSPTSIYRACNGTKEIGKLVRVKSEKLRRIHRLFSAKDVKFLSQAITKHP